MLVMGGIKCSGMLLELRSNHSVAIYALKTKHTRRFFLGIYGPSRYQVASAIFTMIGSLLSSMSL